MIKVIEEAPEKLDVQVGMAMSMEQILASVEVVFDMVRKNNKGNMPKQDVLKMDRIMHDLIQIHQQYLKN